MGSAVIPAQENHPPRETWNPAYELEYWHYGMNKTNEWRERLGLKRHKEWDIIINDRIYCFICPEMADFCKQLL